MKPLQNMSLNFEPFYGIHQQVDDVKEKVVPAHLGIQDVVHQFVHASSSLQKSLYEFDLSLIPPGNAKLHSECKLHQKPLSSGKKQQN